MSGRTEEGMDSLRYSDLSYGSPAFTLHSSPLKPDHCDLLLDAMDAELDQLQVPSRRSESAFRADDCTHAAPDGWSQSQSKDTGLGSTLRTPDTPMSRLELVHTLTMEQIAEHTRSCCEGPEIHREAQKQRDRQWGDENDPEAQRAQVMWRLERLLGEACNEGVMPGETHPPSDSIRTEDFVRRFTEEMVEATAADSDAQQPGRGEASEGTVSAQHHLTVEKRASVPQSADSAAADTFQLNTPGGLVLSFDTVSTDSDVHTVCTDQVRQHTDQAAADRCSRRCSRRCSVFTAPPRRGTVRPVSSMSDDDEDSGDEGVYRWNPSFGPGRRSERTTVKERLLDLQHDLEQLPASWLRMEERQALKCDERESEAQRESAGSKLQRQEETFLSRVQKGKLTTLSQQRQTAVDGPWTSALKETCECDGLDDKQRQKGDQIKLLEGKVGELQDELDGFKVKVATLERMLSTEEVQFVELQQQHRALQAEREGQDEELQRMATQHREELGKAQKELQSMMDVRQAEEEKVRTLKEQSVSLTQQIESLQSSVQLKDEELSNMKKSLQKAKEREEQLREEASETVHKAVEEQRIKWEAVRMHRGKLEEHNDKLIESLKSEIQQEQSRARDLEQQAAERTAKVEDLESQLCAQRKEQKSVLAVIYTSLREEQQRSQKHMEEQSQETVLRLKQELQLLTNESDSLRSQLQEKESSHRRSTAETEQRHRHWAQQVDAECRRLHRLFQPSKDGRRDEEPHSLSEEGVLTHLKTLRVQLRLFICQLYQQLESQRQTNVHLKINKERELRIQKQQLRSERDQAVNLIKERLIQEHIEELSNLKMVHVLGGGAEGGGGVAASLRKQLRAKDLELRQVQRSMAEWKEQTAARLACRFEEELTSELERKKSKQDKGQSGEAEAFAGVQQDSATGCSSPQAVGSVVSPSASDVASLKLLRSLQSRVRQLRLENRSLPSSRAPSHTDSVDHSRSSPSRANHQPGERQVKGMEPQTPR